jgi:hypothetical protein
MPYLVVGKVLELIKFDIWVVLNFLLSTILIILAMQNPINVLLLDGRALEV